MKNLANTPEGEFRPLVMVEPFEYRNTDFNRWHGADGDKETFWEKIKHSALFEKAMAGIQDSIDKKKEGNADSKDNLPAPFPKKETTILGMHPMTLLLGTVGVALAVGITAIAIKSYKK